MQQNLAYKFNSLQHSSPSAPEGRSLVFNSSLAPSFDVSAFITAARGGDPSLSCSLQEPPLTLLQPKPTHHLQTATFHSTSLNVCTKYLQWSCSQGQGLWVLRWDLSQYWKAQSDPNPSLSYQINIWEFSPLLLEFTDWIYSLVEVDQFSAYLSPDSD